MKLAKQATQKIVGVADQFEPEEVDGKVVIKRQSRTFGLVFNEIKRSFAEYFANRGSLMVLVGIFLRTWSSSIVYLFIPEYFRVFSTRYESFINLGALWVLIAPFLSQIITISFVDFFDPRSENTYSILVVIKAVLAIPFYLTTFM